MADASSKPTDSELPPVTLLDRVASPRVVPLLMLAAWIAVCCLSVAPLMDRFSPNDAGAFFVYFCFGAIGAGAGLTAIWGAIGPGPFALRIGLSISSAVQLFACFVLGYAVSETRIDVGERRQLLAVLLCIPIVYFSIQLPLWMAGFLFSWRCDFVERPPAELKAHRLTIRRMMIGTALIAMSLAMARAAASFNSIAGSEYWMVLAVACASTAGVSTVGALPVIWATLLARRLRLSMIGLWSYAAIAICLTLTVISYLERRGLSVWEMFGITTMLVSFVGFMTATLLALRLLGFRLVARRPMSARPVPVDRATA
jgi:hypothetical protein